MPPRPAAYALLSAPDEPPKAPRAMLEQRTSDLGDNIDSLSNEEANLYPRLLLYHCLGPFQRERTERQYRQVSNKYSNDELCRSFLDSIGYLCDVEKGGSTVTAAALTKREKAILLWLAANEGVPGHVKHFIRRVVRMLADVNSENRKAIETLILRDAVKLASDRMEFYRSKMVTYSQECRRLLSGEKDAKNLRAWLRKVQYERDWYTLAVMCYDARGRQVEEVRKRSGISDHYVQLAHHLGRLGAHSHAVSIIIMAVMNIQCLRHITDVCLVRPSAIRRITLPSESVDFYSVVKRLCTNMSLSDADRYQMFHALVDKDFETDPGIQDEMQKHRRILTRVHGELQLLDYLSRHGAAFVDDDRYIGCSKGACYFCYTWISMHHKGFVLPPTHGKVILGCRGPDVDPNNDVNGNGAKIRRKMHEKMIKCVEGDILEFTKRKQKRLGPRFQSSDGSSRVLSIISAR